MIMQGQTYTVGILHRHIPHADCGPPGFLYEYNLLTSSCLYWLCEIVNRNHGFP